MERFGVNASKSRSEVTPREWFETYGSKPELREPPKRRHFAAITLVAETRPFRPCEASVSQQEKTQGSKGGAFTPPLVGVGRRHTGLKGRLSPRPLRIPGS